MSFSIQSLYSWYRNTLRNPKYRWWIVLGTIAYLISPIDIAPDFLPIIGQIDDIAILTLLVSEVSQMAIEYAKSRQAGNGTAVSDPANDGFTSNPGTVDVDAVSVK
ncbi:MAG TPA: YkvA family protein [Kamptonema sp.]|nr:YkvA family protein [Kamptonema sp.]